MTVDEWLDFLDTINANDANKLHRLDGPAVEWPDGAKEWYVDGKQLPTEEVEAWLEENKIDL